MPNITFANIVSTVGAPGNFIASRMSTNFKMAKELINASTGGFDSANYATNASGFASQHVSVSQFGSAHLTSGAIVAGKFSSNQIGSSKVCYLSASSGAMVVQAPGVAYEFLPYIAQCSKVWSFVSGTQYETLTFVYSSDAMYGNPSFTATPVPIGLPVVSDSLANSADRAISACGIMTLNSVSCVEKVHFYGVVGPNVTITVFQGFMGVLT